MGKQLFYQILSAKLRAYGISWSEFKASPQRLIELDSNYRNYWMHSHPNRDRHIRWYNNDIELNYEDFIIRGDNNAWTQWHQGNK